MRSRSRFRSEIPYLPFPPTIAYFLSPFSYSLITHKLFISRPLTIMHTNARPHTNPESAFLTLRHSTCNMQEGSTSRSQKSRCQLVGSVRQPARRTELLPEVRLSCQYIQCACIMQLPRRCNRHCFRRLAVVLPGWTENRLKWCLAHDIHAARMQLMF